jgi:VWFA-related protein
MRNSLWPFLSAFLVLMPVLPCFSAQQPAAGSTVLQVTLIATGKDGAVVPDLRAEEVRLKDNGKQQKVVSFEKVTAREGGVAASDPGKAGLNNIVLLDALNTVYSDKPAVRLEIARIFGELTTADGLTLLMLRNNLTLLHDSTGAGPSILRKLAAQGVKNLAAPSPNLDPYAWLFGQESGLGQFFVPSGVLDRARIMASLNVLQTIAVNMSKRSGRKNLIWISTNFPLLIGHDQTGFMEQSGDATGTPTGGATGDLRSKGMRVEDNGAVFAKDMEMAGRTVNNANLTVYPVDARTLATGNSVVSDVGQLKDMAKFTGGIAYSGRTDVAKAVREALNDGSVTYVLSYQPSDWKADGKFHPIKIETTRKDVKFRQSEGYWAPSQSSR